MPGRPISPALIKEKAEDIIYNRIGTSVGSGTPKLIEREGKKIWVIPIESDYPRIIRDQTNNIIKYKILHVGKVGEIELDEYGENIKIPRRSEIDNIIDDELANVQNRISRLLLRTESNKYAKLVTIKHLANPFTNIITNVIFYDEFILPKLDTKYGMRILNYVKVLEKMRFIIKDNDVIKQSVYLQELYDKTNNDIDYTLELVLKNMIENEYESFYGVNPISPYIKIPSSYYDYALSAEDLITLSKNDLWNAYYTNYPGYADWQRFRFPDWLRVLSNNDIQILSKKNDGYEGNEAVFEVMVDEMRDSQLYSGMMI